jgi:hypothetical protein
METYIIYLIIFVAAYLDCLAMYYAYKSEMYSNQQLAFQLLLVLILPLIAAIFVITFSVSNIQQYRGSTEKSKGHLIKLLTLSFFLTPSRGPESTEASSSRIDLSVGDGGGNE